MRHVVTPAPKLSWLLPPVLGSLYLGTALAANPSSIASARAPATMLLAPAQRKIDFTQHVLPLLRQKCFGCHAGGKLQGGLRLDSRADLLRGGDTGPAVQPGKSAESLLIRYVTGANGKVMPPSGERLTAAQVGMLRAWIDQGVPWSNSAIPGTQPAAQHWAFVAPKRPAVPKVKNPKWVRNPIDAFVLARLEQEGLQPSPEADRATLLRRLSLDLLGLPPTPEETAHFVSDPSPDAYEKLVDRLLASPHFGERWGRHWLDLARYADSDGYEKDLARPYAYLYRDWVIDAFNRDLPYDRFSIEQLAGDLLPNATLEQKIATGFHRNTLKNREGGVDQEEDRVKIAVDRTSTTGTVWLGLTVGCAECHSHKFDPISQREFYGLYAFFNSVTDVDIPAPSPEALQAYEARRRKFDAEHAPLVTALAQYEQQQFPAKLAAWLQQADPRAQGWPEAIAAALATPAERRMSQQQSMLEQHYRTLDPQWRRLSQAVAEHAKQKPTPPDTKAQVLSENPQPPVTQIHIRGDFLRKGDAVEPHVPSVLHDFTPAGTAGRPNRLNLARWLFTPDNPLTARVAVNRIWQHLFGRGLVATPDDFGTRGERPSHPELLDWLATEYPARQWSRKSLIRLIVTSSTYRQASDYREDLVEKDPRNVLLARQNRHRPEAEVVRDIALAASGLLNRKIGGPSIRPPLPGDIAALGYAGSIKWQETQGPDRYRRGMYIFFQRTVPYPQLTTFDAPDAAATCTRRERSNTPLQALTLLNDPVFVECAQALGVLLASEKKSAPETLRLAYLRCFAREPSPTERVRTLKLYDEMRSLCARQPENAKQILGGRSLPEGVSVETAAAWVLVARTLLNLDEFITRE